MDSGRNAKGGWRAWVLGNRSSDTACGWALLPLRVVLGLMFAVSGAGKAFGWFGGRGFDATVTMVRESVGLQPAVLFAVLLILAELVGGILLIVGVAPRLSAFVIAVAMVVAFCTVLRGAGYGGTRFQQLIVAGCVTIMIAGSGAGSIMRSRPPSP